MSNPSASEQRAFAAVEESGIPYRRVAHGHVANAQEAAAARGVEVRDLIKTIVVRRGDNDFVLVLVPGGRAISWPKLRSVLGVNRLSLPDADLAREATGYERGTITPFGALHAGSAQPWPVIADPHLVGRTVAIGAGAHGVGIVAQADDMLRVLSATVADVTDPSED